MKKKLKKKKKQKKKWKKAVKGELISFFIFIFEVY